MRGKKIVVLALLAALLVIGLTTAGCTLFQKKAATVNGDAIPMSEVESQLNKIASQHKTKEQKEIFKKQEKEFRKSILDQLINDKLYEQEAEKMGIKVTDKAVDDEVARTKKRFQSEDAFNKALKDAQFTMDELKDFIRINLIRKKVNEKVVGKITLSDADAKDYYDKNKEQFKEPEQVHLYQIQVKTEEDARKVYDEIAGGSDFGEAAKKYSTDPLSKDKGGDVGFQQKGMMPTELETAAFSIALNEVSQPIKTQLGFHVIKVTEKKDARQKTYDEVKSSIDQMLKAQKETDKVRKWLEGIKKKSTIKTFI